VAWAVPVGACLLHIRIWLFLLQMCRVRPRICFLVLYFVLVGIETLLLPLLLPMQGPKGSA